MKLKQPLCHLFGHTEEDQKPELDRYYPGFQDSGMNKRVTAYKDVYCGKCGEQIGMYAHVDSPSWHEGLTFSRPDVYQPNILWYRSGCWCGWISLWTKNRQVAQEYLDEHCT